MSDFLTSCDIIYLAKYSSIIPFVKARYEKLFIISLTFAWKSTRLAWWFLQLFLESYYYLDSNPKAADVWYFFSRCAGCVARGLISFSDSLLWWPEKAIALSSLVFVREGMKYWSVTFAFCSPNIAATCVWPCSHPVPCFCWILSKKSDQSRCTFLHAECYQMLPKASRLNFFVEFKHFSSCKRCLRRPAVLGVGNPELASVRVTNIDWC